MVLPIRIPVLSRAAFGHTLSRGVWLWTLGCASASPAPVVEKTPTAASPAPKSAAPNTPARPAPPAAASPPSAAANAPARAALAAGAPSLDMDLVQVLSVPVHAIGLGDGTRIAVLADQPYVGDARGLRPIPLPASLRAKPSETDELDVFFGRDNEPRIMGTRHSDKGERAVYLRHLPSGWRDGREEIGQLGGSAAGGLWGVLGSADPELVCRAGAICIIKRTSGWTSAPAGSVKRSVTLQDGVLWGLEAGGISGIDKNGWTLAIPAPAWTAPRALWATRGEAWVAASAELFHYRDGAWLTVPSPVGVATSFWGARADSVWVVGSAGAAHFDGRGFRPLLNMGPLHVVRGRSDAEVWFGGERGLTRGQLSSR